MPDTRVQHLPAGQASVKPRKAMGKVSRLALSPSFITVAMTLLGALQLAMVFCCGSALISEGFVNSAVGAQILACVGTYA